jgi:hypothetical protein
LTNAHCNSWIDKHIIGRAIPGSLVTKFLDQAVPMRPDIAILNEEQKKAYLVDVTCPCETVDNLAEARVRKLDKYADVK